MDNMSSVVATAAATISRDKFLRPLRDLCVRKIALSLKFYMDSGVTSLHSYLLPNLCDEVFEIALEQVNRETYLLAGQNVRGKLYSTLPNSQVLKIAYLFVHSELKCFKSLILCKLLRKPNITRLDIEERSCFFKKLAEEAPNLATFDYHYDFYDFYDRIANCSSLLPSDYIHFGKMSQLNTLTLDFDVGFSNLDLQIIGLNMPLLRKLDIPLRESVTIEGGVKHLQQLKMLEYLVINSPVEDVPGDVFGSSVDGIIEFCLVKMPKLKIAGYEVNDERFQNLTQSHDFSFFERINTPVELSLEHLKLWYSLPPANVRLPHVTHLLVSSEDAVKYCLGCTFPNIQELTAYEVQFKNLMKMLQHLGHLLTKLVLSDVKGMCEPLEILNLCPHLECLTIEKSYVKDIGFINPSVIRSLNKMKKLCLQSERLDCTDLTGKSFCKAPGLLRLLMTSCPDLEKLDLQLTIPRAEVDEVAAGIAAGAYMCISKMREVDVNFKPAFALKSMENFIMRVAMHCPKLIRIGATNARSSKFVPLVNMMGRFGRHHVIEINNHLQI